MNTKIKKWIDNASYESMLRKVRFAPLGDPLFQLESGEYFHKVMGEKCSELKDGEHAEASKRIGWNPS